MDNPQKPWSKVLTGIVIVLVLSTSSSAANIDPAKTLYVGKTIFLPNSNFSVSLILHDSNGILISGLAVPYPPVFLSFGSDDSQLVLVKYASSESFSNGILNASFFGITKSGRWTLQIFVLGDIWAVTNVTISTAQLSLQKSILYNKATVRAAVIGNLVLNTVDMYGNPTLLPSGLLNPEMTLVTYCTEPGVCGFVFPNFTFGPLNLVSNAMAEYVIAYETTRSGMYTIELTFQTLGWLPNSIIGNLSVQAQIPAANIMVLDDLPNVTIAGEPTNFSVQGRDVYGNDLTTFWTEDGQETNSLSICLSNPTQCGIVSRLSAAGPRYGLNLPAPIPVQLNHGSVTISFTLTQAGLYHVDVWLPVLFSNGSSFKTAIRGSPYSFTVKADESGLGTSVVFSPSCLNLSIAAGQNLSITMTEYDRYGNQRTVSRSDFQVVLIRGISFIQNFSVSALDSGIYRLTLMPTKSGNYSIQCRYGRGVVVPSSPFSLQVVPGELSAEGTLIVDMSDAIIGAVGSDNSFEIESGDKFQNHIFLGGLQKLISFNITACVNARIPCSALNYSNYQALSRVHDNGGGIYELSYSTTVGGWFSASIKVNGELILVGGLAMPFGVLVDAGFPNATNSFAFTNGETGCVDIIAQNISLQNLLSCSIAGSDAGFKVRIEDGYGNWRIVQRSFTTVQFSVRLIKMLMVGDSSAGLPLWNDNVVEIVKSGSGLQEGPASVDPGTFDITFQATISGLYSIAVYLFDCEFAYACLNGTQIGNSPVLYLIKPGLPFAPFSSAMIDQQLSLATAGQLTSFSIFPRDQYQNRFLNVKTTLSLTIDWALEIDSDSCGPDSENFVKCPTGTLTGSANGLIWAQYSMTLAGTYKLRIYATTSQLKLAGSPFNITVLPSISSLRSLILTKSPCFGTAGVPCTIIILSLDYFGNLRVSGGDLFSVNVPLWNSTSMLQRDYGNGTYDLLILITRTGSYQVQIFVHNAQLLSSPVNIVVGPGPADARNSRIFYSTTESTAGNVFAFLIRAWDQFLNPLQTGGDTFEVLCIRNSSLTLTNLDVKGVISDLRNGSYRAACLMTASGNYNIFVSLTKSGISQELYESPFSAFVYPDRPSVLYSSAHGNGVSLATAGVFATFSVLGRDEFGNPTTETAGYGFYIRVFDSFDEHSPNVHVTCWVPGLEFNSSCQSYHLNLNGESFDVMNFSLTSSGNYSLSLYVSGQNSLIMGTSLLIEPSYTDAANSEAYGSCYSLGTVGHTMMFFIQTKDSFGNVRNSKGGKFLVVMSQFNSTNYIQGNISVLDLQNGRQAVSYVQTKAGVYRISVSSFGLALKNSPELVVLTPDVSDIGQFTAFGQGLYIGTVQSVNVFYLQSKDRFGNLRSQGNDSLLVTLVGGWVHSFDNIVLEPAMVHGQVSYLSLGRYMAQYNVSRSGNFTLTISSQARVGVVSVQNGPFTPFVSPGPMTAGNSVLLALVGNGTQPETLSKTSTQYAIAGQQDSFVILAKDQYSNPLTSGGDEKNINVIIALNSTRPTVYVQNNSHYNFSALIIACPIVYRGLVDQEWQNAGQYIATYPATISGSYTVIAELLGIPLSGSGFHLMLLPGPAEPRMCSAEFPLIQNNGILVHRFGTAGITSSFTIISKDKYDNARTSGGDTFSIYFLSNLSGRTFIPSNTSETSAGSCSGKISCVKDLGNGKYSALFTPTLSGAYLVRVLLNSLPICESGCSALLNSPYHFDITANDVYGPLCTGWGTGLDMFFAGSLAIVQIQAKDLYGNNRTQGRYLNGKYAGEFFESNIALLGPLLNKELCSCTSGLCTFCDTVICNTFSRCPKFSLSPTALGPNDPSNNNGIYKFQYSITRAADYTIEITKLYQGQLLHISGSPFPVTVVAAETSPETTVAGGNGLGNVVAGSLLQFTVLTYDKFGNMRTEGGDRIDVLMHHTTKCEQEEFYASQQQCVLCSQNDLVCTELQIQDGYPKPLTISVNVTDFGNGSYSVKYVPTISGVYSISIKINNTDIGASTDTRSPFLMECSPSVFDASVSTISAADGSNSLVFSVSMTCTLELWPRDRFGNILAVSGVKIQIELCDILAGMICTAHEGLTYVIITFSAVESGTIYHLQEIFASTGISSPLIQETSVQATIQPMSDGSSTIQFYVQNTGFYRMDVSLMDPYRGNILTAIHGSPLNMTVVPVDNTPDPANSLFVMLSSAKFSAGNSFSGQLLLKNKFNAILPDPSQNQVSIQFSGSNPSEISAALINEQNGTFDLEFQSTVSGTYQVQILVLDASNFWGNVFGSPVTFLVTPAVLDVGNSVWQIFNGFLLQDGSNTETIIAGQVFTIYISYRDRYKNKISQVAGSSAINFPSVSLVNLDESSLSVSNEISIDSQSGDFLVNFVTQDGMSSLTMSGSYSLSVQASGFAVSNSPSIIVVTSSYTDPAFCILLVNLPLYSFAGDVISVMVQARDRFGNNRTEGGDNFISIINSSFIKGYSFSTTYEGRGSTQILSTLTIAGNYLVHVSLNTQDIENSPFHVTVLPSNASAAYSRNATPVPRVCTAGFPAQFQIQAADSFGNLHTSGGEIFDVIVSGIITLKTYDSNGRRCSDSGTLTVGCVSIRDFNTGKYGVIFVLFKAGPYTVQAYLRDRNGNEEQIGKDAAPDSASPWYKCNDCPTLEVVSNLVSLDSTYLLGPGASISAAGDEATFTILAKDVYGNDQTTGGFPFTVELQSINSRKIFGSVQDLCRDNQKNCGKYFVSYTLTISGRYLMAISTNTSEMNRSRFESPLIVSTKCFPASLSSAETSGLEFSSDPSFCLKKCSSTFQCCLIGEAASYGIVGQDMTCIIQARDAFGNNMSNGGDTFSIAVQGPSLGESSVSEYNASNGQYLAQYRVFVAGTYTLIVQLRGVNVGVLYEDSGQVDTVLFKGSPFSNLQISNPGTGLEGLYVSVFPQSMEAESALSIFINANDSTALRTLQLNSDQNKVPALAASMAWVDSLFPIMEEAHFNSNIYPNSRQVLNTYLQFYEHNKSFKMSLLFTIAGNYKLIISSGNFLIQIPQSPFQISVFPAKANITQTYFAGAWQSSVFGQESRIFITTRDTFGNDRSRCKERLIDASYCEESIQWAAWAVDSAAPPDFAFAENCDLVDNCSPWQGQYLLTPVYQSVGIFCFAIQILIDNQYLSYEGPTKGICTSLALTVLTESDVGLPSSESTAFGDGLHCIRAGMASTFSVVARDQNMNIVRSVGSNFMIEFTDAMSGTFFESNATGGTYGVYTVRQTITVSSEFSVAVVLKRTGLSILQSPFTLFVVPAKAVANTSLANGSAPWLDCNGLVDGGASTQAEFIVQLRDKFGNKVNEVPAENALHVQIIRDYNIVLNVKISDSYCTDSSKVNLLECYDSICGNPPCWHSSDGTYRVSYTSSVAGFYAINVSLSSQYGLDIQPINGSIFGRTVFSGEVSQDKSYAIGSALESMTAGVQSFITVIVRDQFGNLYNSKNQPKVNITYTLGDVVNQTSPGSWALFYEYLTAQTLTLAGKYSVSILINGIDLADTPYNLTVFPGETDFRMCRASGQSLSSAVAGILGQIFIIAKDSYSNSITTGGDLFMLSASAINPRGFLGNIIQAVVLDNDNGTYWAMLNLTLPGQYSVLISLDADEVLRNSLLCVAGPVDAQESYLQAGISQLLKLPSQQQDPFADGLIVPLSIQARDTFGSKSLICDGALSISIERTASDESSVLFPVTQNQSIKCIDGMYESALHLRIAGQYSVSIKLHQRNIFQSPFSFTLSAGSVAASQCTTAGLISVVQAGTTQTFLIQSRDQYGNALQYNPFTPMNIFGSYLQILGSSSCSESGTAVSNASVCVLASVVDNIDSSYLVSYTPTVSAEYELVVYLLEIVQSVANYLPINRSPFLIDVQPGPLSISNIQATSPVPISLQVNTFVTFNVEARDTFDNSICSAVSDLICAQRRGSGLSVNAILSWYSSPYSVTPDSKIISVTDMVNGMYQISFQSTVAAHYSLDISVDGWQIEASPFKFYQFPSALDVSESTVDGGGTVGGFVGHVATFIITSRDQFGNQLTRGGSYWLIDIFTPSDIAQNMQVASISPSARDNGDGTYFVEYTTTESGNHLLQVQGYMGSNLMLVRDGYNQFVEFLSTDDGFSVPSRSVSSGQGIFGGSAGSELNFTLQVRNVDGIGRFSGGSLVTGNLMNTFDLIESVTNLDANDNGDGTYGFQYVCSASGVYRLSVLLSGDHTQGSPFLVDIKSGPASPATSRTSRLLPSVAGVTVSFQIQAYDRFGNLQDYDEYVGADPFAAALFQSTSNLVIYAEIFDNRDGSYVCSYAATQAGTYTLKVYLDSIVFKQVENIVIFPSAINAVKCMVDMSDIYLLPAGAAGNVLITAKDSYGNLVQDSSGMFNGTVIGNSATLALGLAVNCGAACLVVSRLCPCSRLPSSVYGLQIGIHKSGTYNLYITISTELVSGKPFPFVVSVGPVSTTNTTLIECERQCECTVGNCNICNCSLVIEAGGNTSAFIQSRDFYGNAVSSGGKAFQYYVTQLISSSCYVTGCGGQLILRDFATDLKSGQYEVVLDLSQSGHYFVVINRNNVPIFGSPFNLEIVPGFASNLPSGCYFTMDNQITAGQPLAVHIVSRDAFGNQLTAGGDLFYIFVVGGITSHQEPMVDNNDGTYQTYVFIDIAGSYQCEVTLGSLQIYPYSISFTVTPGPVDPNISLVYGSGLDSVQAVGVISQISIIAKDSFRNTYDADDSFFAVKIYGAVNFTKNSSDSSYVIYQGCGSECGLYTIQSSFTVSGFYSLDILYYSPDSRGFIDQPNHLLQNYPLEIRVVSGSTNARSSFAKGSGLSSCAADIRCSFSIHAADMFGNVVTFSVDWFIINIVSISISSYQSDTITNERATASSLAGVYDFGYQLTISGQYVLRITLYGSYIRDIPVDLEVVSGQIYPSACTAEGMGVMAAVLGDGNEVSLIVTGRDMFSNAVYFGSETNMLASDFACNIGCLLNVESDPVIVTRNPVFVYSGSPPEYVVQYQFTYSISAVSSSHPSVLLLNISVSNSPILNSPFYVSVHSTVQIRAVSTRAIPNCPGVLLPIGATSQDCDIARFSYLLDPDSCLTSGCAVGTRSSLIVLTRDVSGLYVSTGRSFVASFCMTSTCSASLVLCSKCGSSGINATNTVQCCVETLSDGAKIVFFSESPGIYKVDIRLLANYADSNIAISGSPFQVSMIAGNLSFVKSSMFVNSPDPLKVGTKIYLLLVLRDKYGNRRPYDKSVFSDLRSNASGSENAKVEMQDNGDGSFNLIIFATKSGSYDISVNLVNNLEENQDVRIYLIPDDLIIPSCTADFNMNHEESLGVIGNNLLATAGAEIHIVVQPRDRFGNPVPTDLTQFFFLGVLNSLSEMKLSSQGSFASAITVTASGVYSLKIFGSQAGCFENECPQIYGSPYHLSVEAAGIDPEACTFAGSGVAFGIADSITTLSIVARDSFGNKLNSIESKDSFVVSLSAKADITEKDIYIYSQDGKQTIYVEGNVATSVQNGNILVTYKAFMPGIYSMRGYVNNIPMGSSSDARGNCSLSLPCPQIVHAASPTILSCSFSDSGGHILIEFDQDTDKAGQRGIFSCWILFDAATTRSLAGSNNSWCLFQSPSTLDIVLGFGATIVVNDDLVWNSNVLYLKELCLSATNQCFQHSLSVDGTSRAGRPNNPVKSVAVLKAPAIVGPCDNVILDASFSYGSAGRQMQYEFGLVPGTSNDNVVRNFISKESVAPYSSSQLAIPRELLLRGNAYIFVVSVTNFLDVSSLDSTSVFALDASVPLITIEGPKVIFVQSSQSTLLRGNAQISACSSEVNSFIIFSWRLRDVSPTNSIKNNFVLDSKTENTRALLINPGSLFPGYNYTFELIGNMSNNHSLTASASVTVVCNFGSLLALIDGGNRAISIFDDITLDASSSVDFDGSQSSYEWQYQWACSTALGGTCFVDYEGIITSASAVLFIPSGRVVVGTYIFSVTVLKEPGPRTSTAYCTIYVLPSNQSHVTIDNIPKLKINSDERLVLTGRVESGCKISWIQTEGDFMLQYPGLLSTPINLTSIAFLPYSLYPGSSYTFRLMSICNDQPGFAEISLSTNTPPSSGTFLVSPTFGRSSIDLFSLSMSGWVDEAEDLPFKYEFRYYFEESPAEQIPLGLIDLNWIEVIFPSLENSTKASHNLTVIGLVIDVFDGQAQVDLMVQIYNTQQASEGTFTQMMMSRLNAFVACGNTEGIIQTVNSLSAHQNLTCTARETMVVVVQEAAAKVYMRSVDIAGFASALKALFICKCVGSELRFFSDQSVVTALQLTNDLVLNSQEVGLEPTAEICLIEYLSGSLDIISSKNSARRLLTHFLHSSSYTKNSGKFRTRVLPRFKEALNYSIGGESIFDPGDFLISAAANLAISQLKVSVPGEDAKILLSHSIKLMSVQKLAVQFSDETLGLGDSTFSLPSRLFLENSPLFAFYLSLIDSPFVSDRNVSMVASLAFNYDVSDLLNPITIRLPFSRSGRVCPGKAASSNQSLDSLPVCEDNIVHTCRFWDGGAWNGNGCIVDDVDLAQSNTVCHCFHLTEFASIPISAIPGLNSINPLAQGVIFARNASIHIVVLSVLCSTLALYLILFYWGWRKDLQDAGKNISVAVTGERKKKQESIETLDTEGEKALFSSKNAPLLRKAFKEKYLAGLLVLKNTIFLRITRDHKLLCCFVCPRDNFTRPRRVTVLYCSLMGYFMLNTVFCGDESNTFVQKLVGGILSSLIVIPIAGLFKFFFLYLDIDTRTRSNWEGNMFKITAKARTEVAESLHSGPNIAGMASPPQNLKEAGAPSKIVRGYIPRPDQIQMLGSRGVKDILAGKFKRKVKFDTSKMNVTPHSSRTPSLTDKSSESHQQESGDSVGIPRRALPIHPGAKPPAPMVFFPISEDGEIIEDKQERVLGENSRPIDKSGSGKAVFQSKVAKAVVSTLAHGKIDQFGKKKLINRRFQLFAYSMAFMWFTICAYISILYGLRFTADIEQVWTIAVCISILQDFFINEVFIICSVTAFKILLLPNIIEYIAGRLSEKQ